MTSTPHAQWVYAWKQAWGIIISIRLVPIRPHPPWTFDFISCPAQFLPEEEGLLSPHASYHRSRMHFTLSPTPLAPDIAFHTSMKYWSGWYLGEPNQDLGIQILFELNYTCLDLELDPHPLLDHLDLCLNHSLTVLLLYSLVAHLSRLKVPVFFGFWLASQEAPAVSQKRHNQFS